MSSEIFFIILRFIKRRLAIYRTCTYIFYNFNFSCTYSRYINIFQVRNSCQFKYNNARFCHTYAQRITKKMFSSPEPISYYMNEYLSWIRFLREAAGSGHIFWHWIISFKYMIIFCTIISIMVQRTVFFIEKLFKLAAYLLFPHSLRPPLPLAPEIN